MTRWRMASPNVGSAMTSCQRSTGIWLVTYRRMIRARKVGARQERARPQDQHERCDVDRRSCGVRPDQGELRAGGERAGTALADEDRQEAEPRADTACA